MVLKLINFEISRNPQKKYDAILVDTSTGKIKRVGFGDVRYQHFHDKIGIYANLDHNDPERRRAYKIRHEKDRHKKFTAGWFADQNLW